MHSSLNYQSLARIRLNTKTSHYILLKQVATHPNSAFLRTTQGRQQGVRTLYSQSQTPKYLGSYSTPFNSHSSPKLPAHFYQIEVRTRGSTVTHYRNMATNLPKLPDVAKLSTSIVRVMGGNPNKFTLQGSNTYILGTGSNRILIDTAQGFEAWKSNLSQALKDEDIKISTCLLTHWHHDHIGGVPDFQTLCPDTPLWKASGNGIDPDKKLQKVTVNVIEDGMKFSDNHGFEVEAVFCPGHTKDHMAFLVTQSTDKDEIGAMFTADNVLGHGTAVFEDLAVYLRSLDIMKARLRPNARAYPGHGSVIEDAPAKIQEYITHRKVREDEALNVLKYGAPKKPELGTEVVPGKEWGSMEMVKVIYWDVPEHLHQPAQNGLLMVLAKLKGEGKVVEHNGKWKMGEKAAL